MPVKKTQPKLPKRHWEKVQQDADITRIQIETFDRFLETAEKEKFFVRRASTGAFTSLEMGIHDMSKFRKKTFGEFSSHIFKEIFSKPEQIPESIMIKFGPEMPFFERTAKSGAVTLKIKTFDISGDVRSPFFVLSDAQQFISRVFESSRALKKQIIPVVCFK